ncbi:MAG TPA: helix-turn-helix domain-containing protein [Acetobacteraceae bacterium]|nr:helix-turn-helix domain-containing protein [Acetobacteraceae bacterium]
MRLPAAMPASVRYAIGHMRADLARPVSAHDLAHAAGVPERTLRAHFLRFVGLSPLAWLRRARLTAVRNALLAPGANDRVADVAARFGITHAPRFAAEYRSRFGELPSATLERGMAASTACTTPARGFVVARAGPTLLVLPVRVMAGARIEERAVASALAELLAAALSQLPGLAVRLAHPGHEGESSARYGLDGLVTRVGDRLRVVLRLLDRQDGTHLWGDALDGLAGDPLDLQDRAVAAVLDAVESRIQDAEIERAQRTPPAELRARDLVLRALPLVLAADPESAESALRMLEDAMDLDAEDPTAPALAGWCRAQRLLCMRPADRATEGGRAQRLAERALVLRAGDPLVLTGASGVAMAMGSRTEADALLARALAISPRSAWAWERSAWTRCNFGDWSGALVEFQRALRLKGPSAPVANCLAGVGHAHFSAGRSAEAVSWVRQALLLNPRAVWLNRMLVPSYLLLGEQGAAREALRQLRVTYPAITADQIIAGLPRRSDGLLWHDSLVMDGLARLGLPR